MHPKLTSYRSHIIELMSCAIMCSNLVHAIHYLNDHGAISSPAEAVVVTGNTGYL